MSYSAAGAPGVPGPAGAVLVSSVATRQGDVVLSIADIAGGATAASVTAEVNARGTAVNAEAALRTARTPAVQLRWVAVKAAALNAGVAALKVCTFGDSYAQKLYTGIYAMLSSTTGGGQTGAFQNGTSGGVTNNANGGAFTDNVSDYDAWPSGLTLTLGAGGFRTYGYDGGAVRSNVWKVYYVKEAGAGTFKIQIDGVDATGAISANGALGTLGIATVTPAIGAHTMTVVGVAGTVRIIGPYYEDTTASGIITLNVSQGGIALSDAMGAATAKANFQAWLTDQSPDLLTFEMKEALIYGDRSTYAARLAQLFGVTKAGAPNMDVVGFGSPPIAVNDADQVTCNAQLQAACDTAGYTYYDTYALFGSYANLTAMGWQGDGTHVDLRADGYRGIHFMLDTGMLTLFGRRFPMDIGSFTAVVRNTLQIGKTESAPVVKIVADQGFDLDATVTLKRNIDFVRADDGTRQMRLVGSSGALPELPRVISLGDAATSTLLRGGTTGGMLAMPNTATPADWSVRDLFCSGGVAVPTYASGVRPSTAGKPTGYMIYDSTLKIPLWLDASAGWKDATGTVR
jgi:hypothetical protein